MMGSANANVRFVGHANVRFMWLDVEGGLRGTSVWDFTAVVDRFAAPLSHATRYVSFSDKRQRAKVRASVPPEHFATMLINTPYEISYVETKPSQWSFQKCAPAPCDTVEQCMRQFMQQEARGKNTIALAWNMMASDKHVLERVCPTCMPERLLDPLQWFRKHFVLPKNTLGNDRVGTPRNALGVHTMFSALGPSHTSCVDTLYMRECVARAVGVLQHADLTDSAVDLKQAASVTRPSIAVIAQHLMPDWRPPPVTTWRDWVLAPLLFDTSGRLRTEVSKAHKRHVATWLKRELGGVPLDRSNQAALSACKKRAALERIVLRTLCQYKPTAGAGKTKCHRPSDPTSSTPK